MSVILRCVCLFLLSSCSTAINLHDHLLVKMRDTALLYTESPINLPSACLCKKACISQPGCIGATFVTAEKKCGLTTTAAEQGVVMQDAAGHITWLKYNFTYEASKTLEVGPSFFLTSTRTHTATLDGLMILCAAEGGTPANVRTDAQKEEFLRVVPGGGKAWVPVTKQEGVLAWQDGAPISNSTWITVRADVVTSPLNNGVLETNSYLYMKDAMGLSYSIVCARPPSFFTV